MKYKNNSYTHLYNILNILLYRFKFSKKWCFNV